MPKIAGRLQSLDKLSAWFQQHLSFHFNKAASWKGHVQQIKLSWTSFNERCSQRKKLIGLLPVAQSRVNSAQAGYCSQLEQCEHQGPGVWGGLCPCTSPASGFLFLSPGWNQYPCYQIYYPCIINILPDIVDNLEFSLSIGKIPWQCGFIMPNASVFLETAGYWNMYLTYTVGIYMHGLGFLW